MRQRDRKRSPTEVKSDQMQVPKPDILDQFMRNTQVRQAADQRQSTRGVPIHLRGRKIK